MAQIERPCTPTAPKIFIYIVFAWLFFAIPNVESKSISTLKQSGSVEAIYTSDSGTTVDLFAPNVIAEDNASGTLVVLTGVMNNSFSQVFIGLVNRTSGTYLQNQTLYSDNDSFGSDLIVMDGFIFVVGGAQGNLFEGKTVNGSQSGFISKLQINTNATSLDKIWTIIFGNADYTMASSIAIDSSSNMLVLGTTNGQSLDGVASTLQLIEDRVFLRKMDVLGRWLWTKFIDLNFGASRGVEIDTQGNLFLTALTYPDYPWSSGGYNHTFDIALVKTDSKGQILWCQQVGSSSDDDVSQLTLQEDLGSAVFIGHASSSIRDNSGTVLTGGNGLDDAVVMKYEMADGNFQYGTFLGTDGYDYGIGISLNSAKNLLVLIQVEDEFVVSKFPPDSLDNPIFNYTTAGTYQYQGGSILADTSQSGYFYTSLDPPTLIISAFLENYPDFSASTSPVPKKSEQKDLIPIIAGSVAGGGALLVGLSVGLFLLIRKKRKDDNHQSVPMKERSNVYSQIPGAENYNNIVLPENKNIGTNDYSSIPDSQNGSPASTHREKPKHENLQQDAQYTSAPVRDAEVFHVETNVDPNYVIAMPEVEPLDEDAKKVLEQPEDFGFNPKFDNTTETLKTSAKSSGQKFTGWEIDFNELRFVRELGRGAFGVVHLCRWRNTDCVAKQLDFSKMDDQFIHRFLKEAENVRSLKPHPNVCSVFGVCSDPNHPICIVMEYLPDGNLQDVVYDKKITVNLKRLIEFAKDIASGMSHLHTENILHCDLACRNLLVATKGADKYQLKIADFGLSRILESETYTVSQQATFPTRWTAPETFRTGKISRSNDVWSFGVVLWEIMEARRPYMEFSNAEVIQKVSEGYRLPRPAFEIPDALWELIQSCWDADVNKRPSFNEIYQHLCQLEAELL